MRFMILRKADQKTEAGVMPSRGLLEAMGAYMGEMSKAGILLGADGLQASAKGARVRLAGGQPIVIDGPFAETKELVAGFCIIRVASRQEAIDWVKRWPPLDGDVEIEIRQLFEAEDFGEEVTCEGRMRAEAAARN